MFSPGGVFPSREIVGTLSRQLGWSHFLLLLPIKDDLKRDFYAEMCRVERWSVRMLRQKIGGLLFERTALRWIDQHEREPGEDSPLGLILCESAGEEQVELLQLGASGIRVATYLAELPPKALLEKKLRAAARLAREQSKKD